MLDSPEAIGTERFIEDYLLVSAAALLYYDYFSTLHLEISLLWKWSWSYATALYLSVRYLALVLLAFDLWTKFSNAPSTEACRWLLISSTWLTTLLLTVAECILMLRTWAVYLRDKRLAIGFAFAMVIFLTTASYNNTISWSTTEFLGAPYHGLSGCFVSAAPIRAALGLEYMFLSSVQAVVLACVFINNWRRDEFRYPQNKLLSIVYTDGISFYLFLLAVSLSNYIVAVHIPGYSCILSPMQAGLSAVLTARIIFHLRLTAATHSSGIVTTEVYKLSRVIPRESALVFKSQASEMESPSQLMP